MTKVVHCKKEKYDIYIGRPSKWGNPFVISKDGGVMSFEYIREYYGVPAELGRRVIVNGKPGVIADAMGHYIGVLFDEAEPGHILPAHSASCVEYLGMGEVKKPSRSRQRYLDYLKLECEETFAEYLGIKKKKVMA
jgi:hypothetical protein